MKTTATSWLLMSVIAGYGCSQATNEAVNEAVTSTFAETPFQDTLSSEKHFTVFAFAPASGLVRGTNTLKIAVENSHGDAASGLNIVVTPFMPSHGHGTSVRPQVHAKGDDKYIIEHLLLPMSGQWEARVRLSDTKDNTTDSVVLTLNVP